MTEAICFRHLTHCVFFQIKLSQLVMNCVGYRIFALMKVLFKTLSFGLTHYLSFQLYICNDTINELNDCHCYICLLPDNTDENCLGMMGSFGFQWMDRPCSDEMFYVCETSVSGKHVLMLPHCASPCVTTSVCYQEQFYL